MELVYKSGASESAQGTVLDNAGWYNATFQPKIKNFHKGPLVWTMKEVAAQVADQTIQRYVLHVGNSAGRLHNF
jgi:chitin synthase